MRRKCLNWCGVSLTSGLAVAMTTHAPDQAFLAADRRLAMGSDAPPVEGATTEAVLTEARLSAIYGRSIRLAAHEGRMLCFAEGVLPRR